jgi:hypothetical protein
MEKGKSPATEENVNKTVQKVIDSLN